MNNIFILIGPTASGKSNLAMKLASEYPFEIINADLYSVYKELNIGTAKPSKEELNQYNHPDPYPKSSLEFYKQGFHFLLNKILLLQILTHKKGLFLLNLSNNVFHTSLSQG